MGLEIDYQVARWTSMLRAWIEPTPRDPELGRRGERLAARYLRRRGYLILERQARDRMGEADLIAFRREELIFVEVKTRRHDRRGRPEEAVDRDKRRRLVAFARRYLSRYGLEELVVRFDVIGIEWPVRGSPRLRHWPAAFVDVDD